MFQLYCDFSAFNHIVFNMRGTQFFETVWRNCEIHINLDQASLDKEINNVESTINQFISRGGQLPKPADLFFKEIIINPNKISAMVNSMFLLDDKVWKNYKVMVNYGVLVKKLQDLENEIFNHGLYLGLPKGLVVNSNTTKLKKHFDAVCFSPSKLIEGWETLIYKIPFSNSLIITDDYIFSCSFNSSAKK